jgi:catechol 2,3-dioxygenase-like lactoylglutathione lyase family enzyme
MFERMDHVGLSVSDIEKAIAFYRDVIGMEKALDREFDRPLAQITGLSQAKARVVHMKLGDSVVELFQYLSPQGRQPEPDRNQSDLGLTHIGFMVKDFHQTRRNLEARGVAFLGDTVEIRPGVFVAYFKGVEHEICEMREITT